VRQEIIRCQSFSKIVAGHPTLAWLCSHRYGPEHHARVAPKSLISFESEIISFLSPSPSSDMQAFLNADLSTPVFGVPLNFALLTFAL